MRVKGECAFFVYMHIIMSMCVSTCLYPGAVLTFPLVAGLASVSLSPPLPVVYEDQSVLTPYIKI